MVDWRGKNKELKDEVGKLNDVITDLENTINVSPNSVVASYEVNGKIWKIDVVEKGSDFTLPIYPETDTQVFNGWKIAGTEKKVTTANINDNTKYVADMLDKDWIKTNFQGIVNLSADSIWSDGNHIYDSFSYVLGKNHTWIKKDWDLPDDIIHSASYIWTDGVIIYYSYNKTQYVLNPDKM